jgi:hypothetical protein
MQLRQALAQVVPQAALAQRTLAVGKLRAQRAPAAGGAGGGGRGPIAVWMSELKLLFASRLSNRWACTKAAALDPPWPARAQHASCARPVARALTGERNPPAEAGCAGSARAPSKTPNRPTTSPFLGCFLNCARRGRRSAPGAARWGCAADVPRGAPRAPDPGLMLALRSARGQGLFAISASTTDSGSLRGDSARSRPGLPRGGARARTCA